MRSRVVFAVPGQSGRNDEAAPTARPVPTVLELECCECGAAGMFGENVALLKGEIGEWYCAKCAPARLRGPHAR